MIKLARTAAALAAALCLAACAAETLYAGSDAIVFTNVSGTTPQLERVAEAHCERFGKRAQLDDTPQENAQRRRYRCIE